MRDCQTEKCGGRCTQNELRGCAAYTHGHPMANPCPAWVDGWKEARQGAAKVGPSGAFFQLVRIAHTAHPGPVFDVLLRQAFTKYVKWNNASIADTVRQVLREAVNKAAVAMALAPIICKHADDDDAVSVVFSEMVV